MPPRTYLAGDSLKRKTIFGALVASLLLAAAFYYHAGSGAPAGQPPLQSLTAENLAEFENEFNAAKDNVRVLLLLSPT
jgi:hypothetical protein